MWQVLLAAAVAGSGLFAKRLLSINDAHAQPITVSERSDQKRDQFEERQCSGESSLSEVPIPPGEGYNTETGSSTSIFRFSSSGSRFGSRASRKKPGDSGGVRGNLKGFKKIDVGRVGKEGKCGDGSDGAMVDRRKSVKRFSVCLKKRRISKNATGKCESCSSKDNTFFGQGLGLGMMYMISAAKAEVSRLNNAMDKTAKTVQELKTEISKRKSLHSARAASFEENVGMCSKKTRCKHAQNVGTISTNNRDDIEISALPPTEDGECASSVLTEEPQLEVLEIDQLEAELEAELRKLPWCPAEVSSGEWRSSDISEAEVPAEVFEEPKGKSSYSKQLNGVLPSELDQKLCHLLIEQQESQIVELESGLHRAHLELHKKEAELQALKDCVRRLTEFSLATASDGEAEIQLQEEKKIEEDGNEEMEPELKTSVVGMKRAMEFESHGFYIE